jgi:hypothetical protein
MAKPLTADEILPLVKHLTPPERTRLIRLIAAAPEDDAGAYCSIPAKADEFTTDDELLAWDAEGWESIA